MKKSKKKTAKKSTKKAKANKKVAKKKAKKSKKAKKVEPESNGQVHLPEPEEDGCPYVGIIDDEGVMHVRLRLVDRGKTATGNSKFGFPQGGTRFVPTEIKDAFDDALSVLMPSSTIVIVKDRENN